MWYTPNKQLTYNRIFNFVVGVRGGGKTFNTLKHAIRRFEKTGEQFIYLRRRKVDLDDSCTGQKGGGNLFSDIVHHGYFDGVEFKVAEDKGGGYNFYYNDKIMGYGKALSTARRSTPLPLVELIIFDEFLIDDTVGHDRYLNSGNEMFLFNNFYETIARGRDIPCIFIGNAFSMVNPYFLELGIRVEQPDPNKIYRSKFWTALFWQGEDFLDSRRKTMFFQATKDSGFNKHAFSNSFYLDRKDFVKKRTKDSEHQFSLVYLNRTYGVWVDWDRGEYYVSTKGANTTRDKTISMSLADNKPNNVNIRRYRNMPFMRAFRMATDNNAVYFDSLECYNKMSEVTYLLKTIT